MIDDMDDISPMTIMAERKPRQSRGLRGSGVTVRDFNEPHRTNSSAIWTKEQIATGRPWFSRFIGVSLLIISFAGTMAWCNGGWIMPVQPAMLAIGFLVQAGCTMAEWFYRDQWDKSLWYVSAVFVDIGTSIAGYHDVLAPPLRQVVPFGEPGVWIALIAIMVVIAVVPETILID